MALGLILGVEAEPTQEQFQELLDKELVPSEGFTFETLSVSAAEAADRTHVRELYRAACAKNGWYQGMALAEVLEFADLVVQGGRLVVVKPPTAPPEAAPGGIIAGIGFTPDQTDLETLREQVMKPSRQYVVSSFSETEAHHDDLLITAYLATARRRGWPSTATEGVAVARHTVDGKRYLLIEPAPPNTNTDALESPGTGKKRGWFRRRARHSGSG